jgi:hypothetical protein
MKERTPIPYFSIVVTFGFKVEPIKELGGVSQNSYLLFYQKQIHIIWDV